MSAKGISQAELARLTDVKQYTISRILKPSGPKGIKEPTDRQVRPLADFFGVTTDQLRGFAPIESLSVEPAVEVKSDAGRSTLDFVKEMVAGNKTLSEAARQRLLAAAEEPSEPATPTVTGNVITADFSKRPFVGDEIRIAHYDVAGAMGGGKVVHDYPEMFHDITVSQAHLRELGVTYKDPSHLKLITGKGQSMAPLIQDLDPLMVDASIREFAGDGVYAFVWQGHFYIKTLQMLDADHFKMKSANPDYDPVTIRIDETYIQCKVLLVWNARKL